MSKNNPPKEKVVGTNCYNCKFVANNNEPVTPQELNSEGGINPKNADRKSSIDHTHPNPKRSGTADDGLARDRGAPSGRYWSMFLRCTVSFVSWQTLQLGP